MEDPYCDERDPVPKKIVRELPEDLKKKVRKKPYYFVYEGGSDGTLGNSEFHVQYGEWMPEISSYAAEFLTSKGKIW